ncbi:MAG: PBP1A family penicillin-binding protein [Bacteroidetes bacterium]|nr:PBP1A family penicillin-binding protein [Bacteroidota bacterium]MCL6097281.1 PBP1A family penicillin-binding protein [Bacteroidota bacterium]
MNAKQMPQKNRTRKLNGKNRRYIILGGIAIFIVAVILFFSYVYEGLPTLDKLENPQAQLASNVWSKDGVLLGQFYNENRVEVSIDSIPPVVINALISTEDKSFYKHWGVDLQRLIKAMVKNVLLFKREGASTITQQLAKNLYSLKIRKESLFDTFVRKIREWITAIQIEKTYTKREILEMYFNISWFGHGAYGIATAARTYFDKDVKGLNVSDAGVIVALLKSAVIYDPFKRYENSLRRRNLVMQNMVDEGFLSEEQYEKLKLEPIKLSYKKIEEGVRGGIAPHFVEYIRQQMEKLSDKYGFNLYQDGLNIYTTLDSRMQKIADNAVQKHINEFQKQFDKHWRWDKYSSILKEMINKAIMNRPEYRNAENATDKRAIYNRLLTDRKLIDSVKEVGKRIEVGFVCIDPSSGEIRSMVGGRDPRFAYGLNHATQIRRQPGSSFKPIVYSVAIDNGLYPAYPILNQPFDFHGWSPQNFDHSTGGFTTLRTALALSINIVAGRLIIEDHAPLWKIGRFAEMMGIKSKLDLVPSIALGTSLVSPLELTSAFATLANRGIYNEPISILRIEDKDGVLIDNFTSNASEAIPEETAYIVTSMLQTAIDDGTGVAARATYNFQRPAAGKTGTTQEYADAWYEGYTPQLAAGVWVGFDDHRVSFTGDYGQGARAALPIWAIFMHDVYDQLKLPLEDFTPPASGKVVTEKFCKESIFELGDPKLYSSDCRTGFITDIINVRDIPAPFDMYRDTTFHFFDKYQIKDSTDIKAYKNR